MRMLKVMTKNLRGTNALLVPPDPKVGGTCLPWSPWLLRLWTDRQNNELTTGKASKHKHIHAYIGRHAYKEHIQYIHTVARGKENIATK